ncbi:MAG: hypothetical protein GDA56_09485 [Hormoscilla sp. GM7CHS1pb]|nr:hypothetical protein [Hormoscilla sp. GM7CHS1pb]
MTCDRSPAWVQRPTTTVKASIEELLAIFGEIFSRTVIKQWVKKSQKGSLYSGQESQVIWKAEPTTKVEPGQPKDTLNGRIIYVQYVEYLGR